MRGVLPLASLLLLLQQSVSDRWHAQAPRQFRAEAGNCRRRSILVLVQWNSMGKIKEPSEVAIKRKSNCPWRVFCRIHFFTSFFEDSFLNDKSWRVRDRLA